MVCRFDPQKAQKGPLHPYPHPYWDGKRWYMVDRMDDGLALEGETSPAILSCPACEK